MSSSYSIDVKYIVYTISYIIVLSIRSISVVLWQSELNNYSKYPHSANFRHHNVMEARRKVEPRYSNKTNKDLIELSLKNQQTQAIWGLLMVDFQVWIRLYTMDGCVGKSLPCPARQDPGAKVSGLAATTRQKVGVRCFGKREGGSK